jgi:hypothetical protein
MPYIVLLKLTTQSNWIIIAPPRDAEMFGIDSGKKLNINHQDLFGDAVNLASKMGEYSP